MDSRVVDAGDPRRYRTEIPNIIDDADLSVYAFRLYVHLKRVAGDSGACWQSTRTLAEGCRMSAGQIVKAKLELQEKRFIKIKPGNKGKHESDVITIRDLWPENMQKFKASSPHERASSYSEPASSPHEPKKEPLEERTIEEVIPFGSAERSPPSIIWHLGVSMLTASGVKNREARSFLGGLSKRYGKEEVAKAIAVTSAENPANPQEYLVKVLQGEGHATHHRERETASQRNVRNIHNGLAKLHRVTRGGNDGGGGSDNHNGTARLLPTGSG